MHQQLTATSMAFFGGVTREPAADPRAVLQQRVTADGTFVTGQYAAEYRMHNEFDFVCVVSASPAQRALHSPTQTFATEPSATARQHCVRTTCLLLPDSTSQW